jgi:hypothetical protein
MPGMHGHTLQHRQLEYILHIYVQLYKNVYCKKKKEKKNLSRILVSGSHHQERAIWAGPRGKLTKGPGNDLIIASQAHWPRDDASSRRVRCTFP